MALDQSPENLNTLLKRLAPYHTFFSGNDLSEYNDYKYLLRKAQQALFVGSYANKFRLTKKIVRISNLELSALLSLR